MDDPYEPPQSPEIYIDTMSQSPDESLDLILDKLGEMGYIEQHRARCTAGASTPACGPRTGQSEHQCRTPLH